MASLPPFPSRPPIGSQPIPRPAALKLPEDPPIERPLIVEPMEQNVAGSAGDIPTATIDGNIPTLEAIKPGVVPKLTEADIEQKIQQTMVKRFGQSDQQTRQNRRDSDVDQLVINNIQNDLSGASTWHGPLRNDPWLR